MKCSAPPIAKGSEKAAETRSAIATASSSSARRSTRMPNSSPPKRATMSPGRRWARRRGATARSSSSPAWWPRLSLISLKWSRSRKRIPTGVPETVARFERLRQRVDEAEPVGEPGERVVEDAVAQRLVGGVALDRVGEDVRRGLDEVDVLRGEAARLGRVDVEDAEGPVLALDHDREAAADAEHPQRRAASSSGSRSTSRRRSRAGRTRSRRRRGSRGPPRRAGRRRPAGPRGRRAGGACGRRARPPRRRRCRRRRSRSSAAAAAAISASESPSRRAISPSRATVACWAAARFSSCSAILRSVMS